MFEKCVIEWQRRWDGEGERERDWENESEEGRKEGRVRAREEEACIVHPYSGNVSLSLSHVHVCLPMHAGMQFITDMMHVSVRLCL